MVKESIFNHHHAEMKEEVSKMKKLDPIKGDDFREVPEYFNGKWTNGISVEKSNVEGNPWQFQKQIQK